MSNWDLTIHEDQEEVRLRDRSYLPHWERKGAIYFVTFRLADALPQAVLTTYQTEREALRARLQAKYEGASTDERLRLERFFSARIQRYLDTGIGCCHLRNPAVAALVARSLLHFNGIRYRLFAWCLMPNHVHVVVQPLEGTSLAAILHSWKSFTAHEASKLLVVKGAFWQREYYDHLIRDERDFQRIITYVVNNPLKAHLVDWPWVGVEIPDDS